jgi:hypothetical protein
MQKKITVRFSKDLLLQIDRETGPDGSRSAFIEEVLIHHIQKLERDEINARDFELINANADYFNAEMKDVLRCRADIFEEKDSTL